MDLITRLAQLFEKFPGIGPRQAMRFVQFLLRSSPSYRREFYSALDALTRSVHQCPSCLRFHAGEEKMCALCTAPRDTSLLAIVATDTDIDALERSGSFRGYYFVLGGTISLATEKKDGIRLRELLASITGRVNKGLKEIVVALPANPEGDFTASHTKDALDEYATLHGFSVTMLGRGLSTGSELEYADPDTLRAALASRK
jgi:recombination protein RecR